MCGQDIKTFSHDLARAKLNSAYTRQDMGNETLHVLNFRVFVKKHDFPLKLSLDVDLLRHIRDHWDTRVQSHILVYWFVRVYCIPIALSQWSQYVAMIVLTILVGGLTTTFCYPSELFWGILSPNVLLNLSILLLTIIICIECFEIYMKK